MRTPGLAAIIMAFAIAACSNDVAAPVAMGPDAMGPDALSAQALAHFSLGDQKDQCDDNDNNHHRWGRHSRHFRFRHWGWRGHDRRHWGFRGHDDNNQGDCDGEAKTGSISGTVTNDDALAAGYSVFLLSADGATVVATTTTDATGAYSFGEVAAGTYLVCEENPFTEAHGFLGETDPQLGGGCPTRAYASVGFSLTLAAGATLSGNNFSNMRLG